MIENFLTLETLVVLLTVLATTSMAISGVIQAYRHDFDVIGAGILALITAVGGGTVRDLLLGATPVFWITDLIYIATVLPVAVLSVFVAPFLKSGGGKREQLLNYFDAIGLALFTIVGIEKALSLGVSEALAVILGTITGVAGGMIRDLLCGEPPVVLKSDLYIVVSLAGGALLVALMQHRSFEFSSLVAFCTIVLVRFWVIYCGISLPTLRKKQ